MPNFYARQLLSDPSKVTKSGSTITDNLYDKIFALFGNKYTNSVNDLNLDYDKDGIPTIQSC